MYVLINRSYVLSNKALYPIEQYLIFHVSVAPSTCFPVLNKHTDVSFSFLHAPVHLLQYSSNVYHV